MKKKSIKSLSFIIFLNIALITHYECLSQSVEVLGQLKLDPTYINENDNAFYALVLDTNNAVAFKSAYHIGVPSSGIILSEVEDNPFILNAGFTKKGKFVLPFEEKVAQSGNTFVVIDTLNNPPSMIGTYAIWTGTEMLVWDCVLNTGGKYNPSTDAWTGISNTNSPSIRINQSVVWTGEEMIIWGGVDPNDFDQINNTGARYNPNTDTWTPISTTNAPGSRYGHTAVWTGQDMIIWGGIVNANPPSVTNTGSRYNPTTNSWAATSLANAHSATVYHTATWTGQDIIVHGGAFESETKKYDPIANTWTTLAYSGSGNALHTAVWTGEKMIIWGGITSFTPPILGTNSGKIYDPNSNTWQFTTLTDAPSPRYGHTAVWTGEKMIIWGGINDDVYLNTGAVLNMTNNSWTTTSITNAPSPRSGHSNLWTGTEHIIWGGTDGNTLYDDGVKYNPITSGYLPPVNIDMFLYIKN